MVQQVTVHELAAMRRERPGESILLDVREWEEVELAVIQGNDVVIAPMSGLAQVGVEALPPSVMDKDQMIIVYCHHGVRSLDVAAWLLSKGWKNVLSLAGGIDAYAIHIDPSITRY